MRQHENGKFEEESFQGSAFSASTTSLESGFSSVSTARSDSVNEEVVFKTMNMHAEEYERKLQLGEIVYKHAKEYGIPEESLPREYKEAKDLYVKNKQNIDVDISNQVTEKLSGLLDEKEMKEKHGFKSF